MARVFLCCAQLFISAAFLYCYLLDLHDAMQTMPPGPPVATVSRLGARLGAPEVRSISGRPPPAQPDTLLREGRPRGGFAAARRAGALRRLAAGGDGDTELSPFRSYAGPGYDSEAPRFKRRFKVSALLQRRRAAVR